MYCLRACTDAVMNIIHLVYLYAMYMYLYSCACKQARSMFKYMFVSLYHQRSLNKCRFTYKYYQFVALLNI